jgi:hypothetical protein
MSTANFVPTLWSTRLLAHLDKSLVYGQPSVINRDYEGTIATMGDTVIIGQIGDVTIKPYTKGTPIAPPDPVNPLTQSMVIDQGSYFNFDVDDVDARQSAINMLDGAMQRAAYGIKNSTDAYIASLYPAIIAAGSTIPAAGALANAAAAYEALVDLGVLLDTNNAPPDGRFVVIPPWFHGLIRKDDRFVKYDAVGLNGGAALLNGIVGEAAGFTVLKSNSVPVTGSTTKTAHIIGGSNTGWSFADQIDKVEAYRPPDRFADAIKGLHIYGAKVTNPKALAVLDVIAPANTVGAP